MGKEVAVVEMGECQPEDIKTAEEAIKEFRLLCYNYEDKWSPTTFKYFIKCCDLIEEALKAPIELEPEPESKETSPRQIINEYCILGRDHTYRFKLPKAVELPRDFNGIEAASMFVILSLLGLEYKED